MHHARVYHTSPDELVVMPMRMGKGLRTLRQNPGGINIDSSYAVGSHGVGPSPKGHYIAEVTRTLQLSLHISTEWKSMATVLYSLDSYKIGLF